MFDLLVDVHRRGTTVVFVTHDAQLAARAPRTVTVRDGRIVDDTGPGERAGPPAPHGSGRRRGAGARGEVRIVSAALRHKARADLGRHRARTVLTVLTLALALASVATMAVPGLIDRRMADEVRYTRLADVTLPTDDLGCSTGDARRPPGPAERRRGRHPRPARRRRATVDDHLPERAMVWGLDVDGATVDVVHVDSGALRRPRPDARRRRQRRRRRATPVPATP